MTSTIPVLLAFSMSLSALADAGRSARPQAAAAPLPCERILTAAELEKAVVPQIVAVAKAVATP